MYQKISFLKNFWLYHLDSNPRRNSSLGQLGFDLFVEPLLSPPILRTVNAINDAQVFVHMEKLVSKCQYGELKNLLKFFPHIFRS